MKPQAPRRSDRTRAAILAAARKRFADDGYERATIRAIAADADIDPSMVMRYYGSKEQLFATAVSFDLRLPDVTGIPPAGLPEAFVRHFIARWEGDPADDALVVLLRSAVTNEQAAERVRGIFHEQVRPMLAAALGERAAERAGLVSAQLLGLALSRYVLRLPGVADVDADEIAAAFAPAVRAVLA